MWLVYQLLFVLLLVVVAPVLLLLRGRHYLATLPGRLGREEGSDDVARPLWLHAVSVGETAVAATLAGALPGDLPLLVTTVTPTGQARARAAFSGRAVVRYLPFDLAPTLGPFLRRFDPRALVLIEGELWPYLLHRCRRRDRPILVVNARVSDRGFRRLRRFDRVLLGLPRRLLLAPVDRFGAQSPQDRDRLLALGVEPGRVVVTGNLKYESPPPERRPELEAAIRRCAGSRPILVAGSTMRDEEGAVLRAFAGVGSDRALLVLAPRHPERFAAVADLVRQQGLDLARRSDLDDAASDSYPAVLLLDSLGELAALYALADAAFVGGTLVLTGGHNPLEPARFAIPTAVGPSMENFHDMAEQFDRAGAWQRVADSDALATCWRRWLDHPTEGREVGERARQLVDEHRGALRRTLELLEPALRP